MSCPFCHIPPERIIESTQKAFAVLDKFPITKGHALIIPKQHIDSFFDLAQEDYQSLMMLLNKVRDKLITDFTPDSFNIGINDGEVAGRTVPHLHIHLIPRYLGDCPDPRGGIRHIFPNKARWWE